MNLLALLSTDLIWSALAAIGFAILFRTPRRLLPYCAIVGAFGHACRTLLLVLGAGLIPASLVGGLVVGFSGYGLSRHYRFPTPAITVPGIIPLVPGSIAFQSLVTLIKAISAGPEAAADLLVLAAYDAVTAGLIILSLGLGLLAPFLLLRRNRPVI